MPDLVAAPPTEPPTQLYALLCPRCAGPTAIGGAGQERFRTSLDTLKRNTPWLANDYASGEPDSVHSSSGEHGTCARCQLVVCINIGEPE